MKDRINKSFKKKFLMVKKNLFNKIKISFSAKKIFVKIRIKNLQITNKVNQKKSSPFNLGWKTKTQ